MTHNSDFLVCKEPKTFSTYVANCNNKSEANYLVALGYTESRFTQNVCSGIL